MSLILKPNITVDVADGTQLSFYDLTGLGSASNPNGYGYGGNPAFAAIGATRLKIATKVSIDGASVPTSTTLVQYKEYIKLSGGNETVDSKVISDGGYIVPQLTTITVADVDDWEETGYIVYPFWFLPTQAQVQQYATPSNIGETGTTIDDTIYIYDYTVFDNTDKVGTSAVSGTTYIVSGTSAETITYNNGNANTFRGGEVFTANNTNTITAGAGTAEVYVLNSAIAAFAALTYNLELNLINLINTCDCNREIVQICIRLNALKQAVYTNNVGLQQAEDILLSLTNTINQLLNDCSC